MMVELKGFMNKIRGMFKPTKLFQVANIWQIFEKSELNFHSKYNLDFYLTSNFKS